MTVDRVALSYTALTGQHSLDQARLAHVARRLHYRPITTITLPDGRKATVWRAPRR